ncbi:MAG: SH3 domain-containing protein [Clostridia bacterium]|nr:SH3 domain-containing protein [Clostridia bacterium]
MKRWVALLISLLLLFTAAAAEEMGDSLSADDRMDAIGYDNPRPETDLPVYAPDTAGETDPASAEGSAGAVLDLLVPAGDDLMETAFASAYNAFLTGDMAVDEVDGETVAMPADAPSATLVGSFATVTGDTQYQETPGQYAGIQKAASLLFGRLAAYSQNPGTAGQPFRGGFVPEQFVTSLLQSAVANGRISADAVMLSLTDAAGKALESPAYVFARFFGTDGRVTLWLSADMQTLQLLAQINQIRGRDGAGLALSATAEPGTAPDWAGNGMSFTPAPAQTPVPAVDTGVYAYDPYDSRSEFNAFAAQQGMGGYAPAPTATPQPRVEIVSKKGANVRAEPSDSGKYIGVAKSGETYPLIAVTENSYLCIQYSSDLTGYISPKMAGKLPGEENGKRVVVTKDITIHESPTYNSYEPGTAAGGRSYYVVNEENPEWVQIRLKNGAIGYVNRRYIR